MKPIKKRLSAHWKKSVIFTAGLVFLAAAQNSFAGSSAGTLALSADLAAGCTTLTVAGIDFGMYTTDQADLTGQAAGTISVTCPLNLNYRIMVNGGNQPRAALSIRRLQRTTSLNRMTYDLKYLGSMVGDDNPIDLSYSKTAAWANGISGFGSGLSQSYSLTADVFISTSRLSGTYTDSVFVTLQW
ncbi:MAG: SCPU domain-containing protein [Candidatus Electrothrix sp. AU1_5]|nr:SCPU domain-containing protein [Candidatus Electrothrix gigas]